MRQCRRRGRAKWGGQAGLLCGFGPGYALPHTPDPACATRQRAGGERLTKCSVRERRRTVLAPALCAVIVRARRGEWGREGPHHNVKTADGANKDANKDGAQSWTGHRLAASLGATPTGAWRVA
eukprot:4381309-Prymnesium_polylepis.1